MGMTESSLTFDSSMPRTYSSSWREAYGQAESTPRLSSYQAPEGTPIEFVYESIKLSGGQNVDTSEYPYGFWSNTRLNEKPQSVSLKGYLIGERYIGRRTALITALQKETDDDNPGYLDLPLWGRFPVVIKSWDVSEEKTKNGKSDIAIEFVRAGYSDTKRLSAAANKLDDYNVGKATDLLQNVIPAAFEEAVNKAKDITTLAQGFAKLSVKLQSIVGRVQGAKSVLNGMTNKIKGITNLIAQGILAPKELAITFVSAAFGIVSGVMEINTAAAETASWFMGENSGNGAADDGTKSTVSKQFTQKNEKNVLMQFLSAATYTLDEEAITDQQYNTVASMENLYKTVAFGVCAQLLTKLDTSTETYNSQAGLWKLFEKLEDSLDKEDSDVFAVVEECRISCAQMLLSFSYDMELKRTIRKEMPLLELALYLGCDADRIRVLNAVADSFLIKGRVIYV